MITWVSLGAAIRIQQKMVTEFGGMNSGVYDKGLLESALNRPRNLYSYTYAEAPDYAALAANYAYGISKNHAFGDANKRTALEVMELFLGLNGLRLRANDESCVEMICALASSEIKLEEFTCWVKKNLKLDAPAKRPLMAMTR